MVGTVAVVRKEVTLPRSLTGLSEADLMCVTRTSWRTVVAERRRGPVQDRLGKASQGGSHAPSLR